MAVQQLILKGQTTLRQHGLAHTLHKALLKVVNAVLPFKILRGITLQKVDPRFLELPPHYRGLFLSEAMLRHYATDPRNEISTDFLDHALAKNDQCYGIFEGERLAAYGWYSRKPTGIDSTPLNLHFDPAYVYMYKGFTHYDYRGQRLHAIGMNRALQHFLEEGAKGLVSYVESGNFDSLKSCYRLGYVDAGSIYLFRLFGRFRSFASSGCGPYGLRLRRA
ncbi:GNAT family N-acetyltransferase [Pseudomonas knackmussii]|uniref:GNAT family N-acetyltransferase n=1 Tax=Pseudomonas knackmussii TaxID=65741 RepID=UPI0013639A91|nr:GNAT family N-acetyltransferase [Pseudomonas knackmussii]